MPESQMRCPRCRDEFNDINLFQKHFREKHTITGSILGDLTQSEREDRSRAFQALIDLEEIRALHPGF